MIQDYDKCSYLTYLMIFIGSANKFLSPAALDELTRSGLACSSVVAQERCRTHLTDKFTLTQN